MSQRANALATRIEEGAAALASFVEGLSDKEWSTAVARDGRAIGVLVHHVATLYPIEVDVARGIANGKPLDVTWDGVAQLNAGHAREHANPPKSDALALLRKNARDAAGAVRGFSDEQLDRAAPFSLSDNAPMTAQYVIEDHAIRHPWHHLVAIRRALGR